VCSSDLEGAMKDITTKGVVALMVGKESAENIVERISAPKNLAERDIRLEIDSLHTDVLKGVSLTLHEGELLGIGGLKGQGQRDLLLALFGAQLYQGSIKFFGEDVRFNNPRAAMNKGIALVPGERTKEGLLFIRSILENLQLPSWAKYGFPLRIANARGDANDVGKSLGLIMAGLDEPISSLSGGNAQKVVLGKWLLRKPRLLLLDDPTKGVDVGTKTEFYRLLARLCADGLSVLFYSSDDEELLGLCDRVLVMHDGIIRSELVGEALNKSNLVAASLGASQESMQ
jgi:ribose transport system ATP-binding protein